MRLSFIYVLGIDGFDVRITRASTEWHHSASSGVALHNIVGPLLYLLKGSDQRWS